MNQTSDLDGMREEYDFSEGIRGKHYEAYRKGKNIVLIETNPTRLFKDSATVDAASKELTETASDDVSSISD